MDKLQRIVESLRDKDHFGIRNAGEILAYLTELLEARDSALKAIKTKVYTLEEARKVQAFIDFLVQE